MSKRTVTILLVGAAAACWPAGAQARSKGTCATRGTTIAATAKARVFRQGKVPKGDAAGTKLYYGCLLGGRRIVRLNGRGDFGPGAVLTRTLALAGRYVAFESAVPTGAAEDSDIVVIDLSIGKIARRMGVGAPGGGIEDPRVWSLVLTPRGTVAWIVDDCAFGTWPDCAQPLIQYVVVISDGAVDVDKYGFPSALAHSSHIAPDSLALSAGTSTIYWSDAGRPLAVAIN